MGGYKICWVHDVVWLCCPREDLSGRRRLQNRNCSADTYTCSWVAGSLTRASFQPNL